MQAERADLDRLAGGWGCVQQAGKPVEGMPSTRPSVRWTHMVSTLNWTRVAEVGVAWGLVNGALSWDARAVGEWCVQARTLHQIDVQIYFSSR